MQEERTIGENSTDRDTNTLNQVDIDQMQTGDPGRMQNSDLQRMRTAQDTGRSPLSAEGDEQIVDKDIKQKEQHGEL